MWKLIIMSKWYNNLAGSVLFAVLRPRTKSGLRNSILLMALCTLTISIDLSGFSAPNARKHTMWTVSAPIKSNQPGGLFYAPSMNAELSSDTKWVEVLHTKRVIIKRVTVSVLVAKEKKGKQHPERPRWGKDGRVIAKRKAATKVERRMMMRNRVKVVLDLKLCLLW